MNPQVIRGFQGVNNARRGIPNRTNVATNVLKGTNKPKSPTINNSTSATSSAVSSSPLSSTLPPSSPMPYQPAYVPANNYFMVPYVGLFNRDFVQFYPAYPVYPTQPAPISYSNPYYNNFPSASVTSLSSNFNFNPSNRRNFNYSTNSTYERESADPFEESTFLHADMTFLELRDGILKSFDANGNCRLSWFHRMLTKSETEADYERCLPVWKKYLDHGIDFTPETGTLIIKAACKGGVPERGLALLKTLKGTPYLPSMAGIQYLMINLSLKKNTEGVINLYEFIKQEKLKLSPKTFHIVIRDCVDNDLVKEAFLFAKEAKELGIEMNRVCYNILMNGCRKHNMAEEIIQLRNEMGQNNVEINETTVKFTSLAHMMLGNIKDATKSFMEYKDLKNVSFEDFTKKFLDPSESETHKKHATDLFAALKNEGVEVNLAL